MFRSALRITPLLCALLALAAGALTQWRYAPFLADHSLTFFVTHFGYLQPGTVLMIAIGVFAGFWGTVQAPPRLTESASVFASSAPSVTRVACLAEIGEQNRIELLAVAEIGRRRHVVLTHRKRGRKTEQPLAVLVGAAA